MSVPSQNNDLRLNPVLAIIFSITIVSVMGTASIAPAFPAFTQHFGITSSEVALLITVFTIPGIVMIPITGWMADKYGRKATLIPFLILFGLAGFACFFAPSFKTLLWLRFFQGIGSAPLNSLNNTLITDRFSGRTRISAFGYNGGVLSISTALYPAVGGALALVGWNYPFLLPLMALPLVVLILVHIKEPNRKSSSFSVFEYFQTLRRSTSGEVLLIIALVLASFVILYGVFITFLPFLLNDKFHFDSAIIGGLMALMSLGAAFISFRIGRSKKNINLRKTLQFSFLIYAVSILGIAFSANGVMLVLSIVFFGIAQGYCEICALSLLTFHAPKELRGMYMSFNGIAILGGQTIGPLLTAWIVSGFDIYIMFYTMAALSMAIYLVLFFWKT